jgi:hypothetical protein
VVFKITLGFCGYISNKIKWETMVWTKQNLKSMR